MKFPENCQSPSFWNHLKELSFSLNPVPLKKIKKISFARHHNSRHHSSRSKDDETSRSEDRDDRR